MKFHSVTLLLILSSWDKHALAFVPGQLRTVPTVTTQRMPMKLMAADNDLSVPYDAAARLAYDGWRKEFSKGEFDPVRYQQFRSNYEALTAANMAAKKEAREKGTETVDLLTLNEYGDFSEEEYEALQSEGESSKPQISADIMGKAAEAAEAQADASSALGEAADALAEEEQVRKTSIRNIFLCLLNWILHVLCLTSDV